MLHWTKFQELLMVFLHAKMVEKIQNNLSSAKHVAKSVA
jgi:hypothetical protein